eukprot:3420815-Pleurochrysis_carterae.AAC.2
MWSTAVGSQIVARLAQERERRDSFPYSQLKILNLAVAQILAARTRRRSRRSRAHSAKLRAAAEIAARQRARSARRREREGGKRGGERRRETRSEKRLEESCRAGRAATRDLTLAPSPHPILPRWLKREATSKREAPPTFSPILPTTHALTPFLEFRQPYVNGEWGMRPRPCPPPSDAHIASILPIQSTVRGRGGEMLRALFAPAVASGAPNLLVVLFDRLGRAVVHHATDVRLVDAHAAEERKSAREKSAR